MKEREIEAGIEESGERKDRGEGRERESGRQ